MKWIIKLDMENLTDKLAARHSWPTLTCFKFFSHHTKILKLYSHPTNGTFAFAPTHKSIPSAKSKEPFLPTTHLNATF